MSAQHFPRQVFVLTKSLAPAFEKSRITLGFALGRHTGEYTDWAFITQPRRATTRPAGVRTGRYALLFTCRTRRIPAEYLSLSIELPIELRPGRSGHNSGHGS